MARKLTQRLNNEEFVTRAKKVHGDKYDYSLVEYKNSKQKVKITCPVHGVFNSIPQNHVFKVVGCPVINCHNENQIIFIYGLVDERQPNFVRYVGKTKTPKSRLNQHIKESKKLKKGKK